MQFQFLNRMLFGGRGAGLLNDDASRFARGTKDQFGARDGQ
jgi:hypothetical protein